MAGSKTHLHNLLTFIADEDLSSAMNYVVTVSGASADENVLIWDAATEPPVGVLVDWVKDGTDTDTVTVAGPGCVAKVKCGGTVTRGGFVKCDTGDQGKVVDLAGSGGARVAVLGIALETGADGDLVRVLIAPGLVTEPA